HRVVSSLLLGSLVPALPLSATDNRLEFHPASLDVSSRFDLPFGEFAGGEDVPLAHGARVIGPFKRTLRGILTLRALNQGILLPEVGPAAAVAEAHAHLG